MGAAAEMRGAAAAAGSFKRRARAAQPALVDGAPGLLVVLGGRLRVVLRLTVTRGKIVEI
jgi:hypothetical protein